MVISNNLSYFLIKKIINKNDDMDNKKKIGILRKSIIKLKNILDHIQNIM